MVRIRKRTIGTETYYYLEHSLREGSKVEKKELYLGKALPHNIQEITLNFIREFYTQKWHDSIVQIKQQYAQSLKNMPKSLVQKELNSFMIKFTYDTQKIEGSTLTLRETAQLLDDNITPKEKPTRDVKEAEAHKAIFYEMLKYPKELSLGVILNWHRKLFIATKPDIAGKIRKTGVAIAGSKFLPPTPIEIDLLLQDFFIWYKQHNAKIPPVELAALVHLRIVTIHPFNDGNGRMSRLLMNFVLHKHQYPLLDIPYEPRSGYYRALERSQLTKNEFIFVQWFMARYIKEQQRYN